MINNSRRCYSENSNTDQHAVQLDIPLQFEILRKRRGHLRRCELKTFCNAGKIHKYCYDDCIRIYIHLLHLFALLIEYTSK